MGSFIALHLHIFLQTHIIFIRCKGLQARSLRDMCFPSLAYIARGWDYLHTRALRGPWMSYVIAMFGYEKTSGPLEQDVVGPRLS